MNRDFLKELGLEKEVIDQIMAENGKDIEGLKVQLTAALEQVSERDKQLETLSETAVSKEDYDEKIEELQKANQKAKDEADATIRDLRTKSAFTIAAKGKIQDMAQDYIFSQLKDDIKFDEEGNPLNVKDLIEGINKEKYGFALLDEGLKVKFAMKTGGTKPQDPDGNHAANDAIRSAFGVTGIE